MRIIGYLLLSERLFSFFVMLVHCSIRVRLLSTFLWVPRQTCPPGREAKKGDLHTRVFVYLLYNTSKYILLFMYIPGRYTSISIWKSEVFGSPRSWVVQQWEIYLCPAALVPCCLIDRLSSHEVDSTITRHSTTRLSKDIGRPRE